MKERYPDRFSVQNDSDTISLQQSALAGGADMKTPLATRKNGTGVPLPSYCTNMVLLIK